MFYAHDKARLRQAMRRAGLPDATGAVTIPVPPM